MAVNNVKARFHAFHFFFPSAFFMDYRCRLCHPYLYDPWFCLLFVRCLAQSGPFLGGYPGDSFPAVRDSGCRFAVAALTRCQGVDYPLLGGALQMAGLVERRCAAGLVDWQKHFFMQMDCQSTKCQAVF